MIPQSSITQWRNKAPWQDDFQVEQDLIIERALVEIFSDPFLKDNLAFRGGTALHKLHLQPQARYSEDIDLVQMKAGPIKPIIQAMQKQLAFLGDPVIKPKANNNTLVFRFQSEGEIPMKLKVEINCREHFTVFGLQEMLVSVESEWFTGQALVPTFSLDEMMATKLRAMYQRKKGRDLFDMFHAMTHPGGIDVKRVIEAWRHYLKAEGHEIPQKLFLQNMDAKMKDEDFVKDIDALLHPSVTYDIDSSYALIRKEILETL